MKYAHFHESGLPAAFYSDDITPEIPADATPISDAQWLFFISHPGLSRWDGEDAVPYAPPEEPAAVPDAVSPLQARKALRQAGLKPAVDAYVSNLPEEEREEWEYATEIRRDHAVLNAGWAAIGKTSTELDDLFKVAATL